jgi:glycosyltransferase involved in cell wall biosynthesis
MRVAVVAYDAVLGDRDGLARTRAVAEALADRGHEVAVFCAQWWDGYETRRTLDGVEYRAVTVAPALAAFVARLPVLLAAYRPDAIHATPSPPGGVVAAGVGSRLARLTTRSRVPLALDWYGDERSTDPERIARAAALVDAVVCPSRYVQTAAREAGVPDDRTHVVPEFVDFETVRAVEPAADAPDIVAATRLDDDADLDSLFLALAELRRREWSCLVFGDGPERAAYEEQVADLRIDDRVTFAGRADRERRLAAYRGAHVFVQTAARVPFASDLLWALACGCVGVVEYRTESAAHELVERRDRGFRATTPEEVETAIREAGDLERRDLEPSMAEEFGREAVLDRLLNCYGR